MCQHRVRSQQAATLALLAVGVAAVIWGALVPAAANAASSAEIPAVAWVPAASGTAEDLRAAAAGDGRTVVVGDGGTILVATADQWSAASSGSESDLLGVAHGSGRFVAGGRNGTALLSVDGHTWERVDTGTKDAIMAIGYGRSQFVAVTSGGAILTSSDGRTWSTRPSGVDVMLFDIAFGAGRYVVAGARGTILSSTDGQVWTRSETGTQHAFLSVTYGDGRFLAITENGTVALSTDGVVWDIQETRPEKLGLWDVTYGDGKFVAVGALGNVFASTDGVDWYRYDPERADAFFDDVIYDGSRFLAVGSSGTIRTTPRSRREPRMYRAHPGDDHTFTLPEGMDAVLVGINLEKGDADLTLTAPDGRVITPQDAELTPDTILYDKDPKMGVVAYAIRDPMPGTWTYHVTATGPVEYSFGWIEMGPPKEVEVLEPATDVIAARSVEVRWVAEAPPGSTVDLYYTEKEGKLGFLIAAGLDVGAGRYTWDVTDVPAGTYLIEVRLKSDGFTEDQAYAPGRVVVGTAESVGAGGCRAGCCMGPSPGAYRRRCTLTPQPE